MIDTDDCSGHPCSEHSGIDARLTNVEQDVRNNMKKVNALIYLALANLAGIAVIAVQYAIK